MAEEQEPRVVAEGRRRIDNPLVRGVARLPVKVRTKLLIAFVGTSLLLVAVGLLGLSHPGGLAADELHAARRTAGISAARVQDIHTGALLDRVDEPHSVVHGYGRVAFHRQSWHARYVNVSNDMTDAPAIARPSQLWKSLPHERKLQAAEADPALPGIATVIRRWSSDA